MTPLELGIGPEYGLWGLAIASFLSATVLPGGSEALLWAYLQHAPQAGGAALLWCTLGNTLGGMSSWWCGRLLPARRQPLPYQQPLQRWGSPLLVFSWLPLVGDALCLAAGWLRLHWLPCSLCMAAGKFARYWLVVQAA